jgi:ligand-binding SRPBCC domain-containing protein
MYKISANQFLPITISQAWKFFSSPQNLSAITPASLDFRILTNSPATIYEGMKIDYKVKPLLGIPLRWQTEICSVEEEYMFIDKQVKGPYKLWEHTHYFFRADEGILMRDEITYVLPMGFLGRFMHWFIVKNKLKKIFEYRRNTLDKIFNRGNT